MGNKRGTKNKKAKTVKKLYQNIAFWMAICDIVYATLLAPIYSLINLYTVLYLLFGTAYVIVGFALIVMLVKNFRRMDFFLKVLNIICLALCVIPYLFVMTYFVGFFYWNIIRISFFGFI